MLSLTVEYFFSVPNMIGLALSVSQIGMVACAMTFCIASRDYGVDSVAETVEFFLKHDDQFVGLDLAGNAVELLEHALGGQHAAAQQLVQDPLSRPRVHRERDEQGQRQ